MARVRDRDICENDDCELLFGVFLSHVVTSATKKQSDAEGV